jgi:uncharacterized protein (DUF302 family)
MTGHPLSSRSSPEGVITKESAGSVDATVARLLSAVEGRGLKVFSVVDHSGEARAAGLSLRDTKLVIFGSPAAGTAVMEAAPLAALDLPLKALVWSDDSGPTLISYLSPSWLAHRHGLPDSLAARLAGIEPIVDAAVSP